jgi:hypothetical protein
MTRRFVLAAVAATATVGLAAEASAQVATQDIDITANVPRFCSIGGVATPAALNTTIPVSTAGVVNTTAQNFPVASVVCNFTADVLAESQNGGVVSPTAVAGGGFTNIIDYVATATFGGATSTVNTSTTATATGAEGTDVQATSGAATGSLTITITPIAGSPKLPASDYADTLRVTLTPQ